MPIKLFWSKGGLKHVNYLATLIGQVLRNVEDFESRNLDNWGAWDHVRT